ncbi:MAG: sterol desaturase family protein, partial [Myxococcota bacterium]|nr:sterol desaturase family protein [Myxococcota bacterium]
MLLQGASIALFLTMGVVRPRDPRCHSCGNEPSRPTLRCGACGAQGLITADTWLNVFNGLLLFLVFGLAVRAVKAHTELGLVEVSWLTTGGAQFVFSFLLLDFVRYWVHRADHRISWLWMFHRVHHSSERLDATAGLRMHAVDFLQLSAIPIVLFGVVFDTRGFEPWVIEAAFGVGVVFDAFQHANLHYDLDHPLRR